MELIPGSETSTHLIQTPGIYPKENTLRVQYSFNPAPMGLNRCQIIKYLGLLHHTYNDLSCYWWFFVTTRNLGCKTNEKSIPFGYLLQLLVLTANPHRKHTVSCLHCIITRLKFFQLSQAQSQVFVQNAVLCITYTAFCANLGCFDASHLKRPVTFTVDATYDCNYPYISFYHRQLMTQCHMTSKPHFKVCHFQTTYYFKFLRNH
jgi:hypothetical protein